MRNYQNKGGEAIRERSLALLTVAAFFHDVGKASVLFQRRMDRPAGELAAQEPVRHEFISAAVFDALLGDAADEEFSARLGALTARDHQRAWATVPAVVGAAVADPAAPLPFRFLTGDAMTRSVGHLVLSHHRLPLLTDGLPNGERMVRPDLMTDGDLGRAVLAPGTPFWDDASMIGPLMSVIPRLTPGPAISTPFFLRACLSMADSTASSRRGISRTRPEYAANRNAEQWGDDLTEHTRQVMYLSRKAFDLIIGRRDEWPAIPADRLPDWLTEASGHGQDGAGGLFGIISGDDEGERLRSQFVLLTQAAMSDPEPARRGLRVSVVSPTPQIEAKRAKALIKQLGFDKTDVMTYRDSPQALNPQPPAPGCPTADLAGLHPHLDRHRVLDPAVLVCSLAQIGKSASPQYSKDMTASLRMMNSDVAVEDADLIERAARDVLLRLMWQAGASGRRAVISGASIPQALADDSLEAYREGWAEHAALSGKVGAVRVALLGAADETPAP